MPETRHHSSEALGIILLSGAHDRAHTAFMVATGAAALGRGVVIFATNAGCRAMLSDWSSVTEVGRDAAIRARGVAGLGELREQAIALGIKLIACESGLRSEALEGETLLPEVKIAGVATFLSAIEGGQLVSF